MWVSLLRDVRQLTHAVPKLSQDSLLRVHYRKESNKTSHRMTYQPHNRQSYHWYKLGKLAHSPRIEAIEQIPHDQFDEWLVFDTPTRVERFETLVNYSSFNPIDFDWPEKIEHFWKQLDDLQPLHVIGENDSPYLVTRDHALAQRIQEAEQVMDANLPLAPQPPSNATH